MSWLSEILDALFGARPRTGVVPIDPPRPPLYTVRVEVFSGPPDRDEKVPGAIVRLGPYQDLTDGAGNAHVTGLQSGEYVLRVVADTYLPFQGTAFVPGPPTQVSLERDVPPVSRVTLASSAPWLRLTDGRPWIWRYCSALDLLSRTDAEQDAFLDWAQETGFSGVRLLTTHAHQPPLPPALGQAWLPGVLLKLRWRGMGAELVALADTRTQEMDRAAMRAHVSAVGAIVAAADVPLTIELSNEPAHPTQQPWLFESAWQREIRTLIPAHIPVSLGSSCCGQPDTIDLYPGGDYLGHHLDRGRATWQEVARIKHYIELSSDLRRFVVDDEPIGAGIADEPGRRSANPSRFFAQGVLDRLGSIGSTFHFSDGVPARVPGPVQQACAEAFIAGATLVPDDAAFRFVNDSWDGSITRGADWSAVFKMFGFIRQGDGPSYVVALGVTGAYFPTFVNGWAWRRVVAERPGVQVIEVARG